MKLKDLVKTIPWSEIEPVIITHCKGDYFCIEDCKEDYKKLKTLAPKENNKTITIEKTKDQSIVCVNVLEADGTLSKVQSNFEYRFEWGKWLDMEIDKTAFENFSNSEIVARCLLEMLTIYFDEKLVQKAINKMIEEFGK